MKEEMYLLMLIGKNGPVFGHGSSSKPMNLKELTEYLKDSHDENLHWVTHSELIREGKYVVYKLSDENKVNIEVIKSDVEKVVVEKQYDVIIK